MKKCLLELVQSLVALLFLSGLYLIPGLIVAEVLSGLTYGGLPPHDRIHIALTWPSWVFPMFGI